MTEGQARADDLARFSAALKPLRDSVTGNLRDYTLYCVHETGAFGIIPTSEYTFEKQFSLHAWFDCPASLDDETAFQQYNETYERIVRNVFLDAITSPDEDDEDEPMDIGLSRHHPWCGEDGCERFFLTGVCDYDTCDYYDQKIQEDYEDQVRFMREYAAKHPDENKGE